MTLYFVSIKGKTFSARSGAYKPGPLGFQVEDDAKKVAQEFGGTIKTMALAPAIRFCLTKGYVLYVQKKDGTRTVVRETLPVKISDRDPPLSP